MPGVVVPSWDMGQVIGTWRTLNGELHPGKYKVSYPRVTNVTDDAIIPAGVFAEGLLNTTGSRSLDIALPATDDPDNAQEEFTVTIVITLGQSGGPIETYVVSIPAGGTVNLRTIIPSTAAIPMQQPHLKMGVPGGLAVLDAQGRVLDGDGDPVTGGGAGGVADWDTLTGKPAVIAAGASDTEARDAIGAGTSNLALGATSSTAKAGDWTPTWVDVTGKPATFPPNIGTTNVTAKAGDYVPAWSEVTGKPATYAPTIGATATTAVAGNDPRLTDARTPLGHTHTSAQIPDFAEAAQDAVAALLAGASGVTLNYDDAANTLTITGGGSGGLDAEAVRDAIGVALVGAGLINVAVNDAADTITITTTATANSTDAALRDRGTHTGEQAISTVTGLQGALDGKVPTTRTVAGKPLSANVNLAKGDVGLGNVDNTSDANKPVSTATQTALDGKASIGHVHPWADALAGAVCAIVQTAAGAWPAAPSSRTDLVYLWISLPGDTTVPSGVAGAVNLYDARA